MSNVNAYPHDLKVMLSEGKAKFGIDKALEEVLAKWPEYKTRLTRSNAAACVTMFRKVHGLEPTLLCPIDKLDPPMRSRVLNLADRLRASKKRMSAIVKTLRAKFAGVLVPAPRELEKLLAARLLPKTAKKRAKPGPKPAHSEVTGVTADSVPSSNGHYQLIIKGPGVLVDNPITKEVALNIIKVMWSVA